MVAMEILLIASRARVARDNIRDIHYLIGGHVCDMGMGLVYSPEYYIRAIACDIVNWQSRLRGLRPDLVVVHETFREETLLAFLDAKIVDYLTFLEGLRDDLVEMEAKK